MIAIVNVSDELKQSGSHEYELRINNVALTRFTHNREDSIGTCLRKAADAYEQEKRELLVDLVMNGTVIKVN